MWHHSEDAFEQRWEHIKHRFGMNQMGDETLIEPWSLSPFIRHTPDYICKLKSGAQAFLVEVQGTGKDMLHKFKFEKLEMLGHWNKHQDVWFWLWDNKNQRETLISLNRIRLLIAQGKATRDSFDGGKRPYWALPVGEVYEQSDWYESRNRYM